MTSFVLRTVISFVALSSIVYGGTKNLLVPPPLQDDEITQSVGLSRVASVSTINGTSTFQQYIDHQNPGLGTFSQQFWWNAQYWKGPGSPVCLAIGMKARLADGKVDRLSYSLPGRLLPHHTLVI